MKRPVALPHEEKEVRYDFPPELDDKKKKKTKPTHYNADEEGKENATGDSNIFSDFGSEVPQLPPAILEPPKVGRNFSPLSRSMITTHITISYHLLLSNTSDCKLRGRAK